MRVNVEEGGGRGGAREGVIPRSASRTTARLVQDNVAQTPASFCCSVFSPESLVGVRCTTRAADVNECAASRLRLVLVLSSHLPVSSPIAALWQCCA